MSRAETLRKIGSQVKTEVKKPRNLLWPVLSITLGTAVWGLVDGVKAGDQLSVFPEYTTSDGRYEIAKNLFDARKNLEDISATTNSRLEKSPDGEPIIIFEKAFSSNKWEKAREILGRTTKDLKDQPEIINALREIDMEIANGGNNAVSNDIFSEQRREIVSVIPQVAALKDSVQAKAREIKAVEVDKRGDRNFKLTLGGALASLILVRAYTFLENREKNRKLKQKAYSQPHAS